MYLPTLRRGGVELRTIPKLACAEILRDRADALPDVVPAEAKWVTFRADSSERHVNVRVFRVVVRNRHPFERSSEIPLHPRQQIASQPSSDRLCRRTPGDTITFQRRSSPAFCQLSSRSAMSIDSSFPSNPTALESPSCVALSRAT